ncbi:hypothetical protein Tco_1548338 [Tanacetum coccineum]
MEENWRIRFLQKDRKGMSQEKYWGVARHHHKGRWKARTGEQVLSCGNLQICDVILVTSLQLASSTYG